MHYKKIGLIIVLTLIPNLLMADTQNGNKLDVTTEEAIIDFSSEEFSADGGVDFIYPNSDPEKIAKMRAFKLQKIPNKNLIIARDKVIFEQGANKVEAKEVLFNLDDQSTRMRHGVSYVKVEGAPQGNDKIYYGGEEFIARYPDDAFVKNAWFTTSRKALELTEEGKDDPRILPYHMKSRKISVYPDDKIIAYNTVLYIKSVPVLWLPWYASSLKADTQAPLFPVFGSSSDEGSYVIWGFDYGRRQNNYINGSFALRSTSKKGWFIDSWENVYRVGGSDKNKGKLSLTDALVRPKGKYEKEYKFVHEHNYSGDYGSLKWQFNDQTINTINAIKDNEEDYKDAEQKLRRFELETNLSQLGPSKDISLSSNIQYISNKEVIKQLVGEEIEKKANDSEIDNDIISNVKLTKDNRNYRLFLHFDYLEDLDPGSSYKDTESERRQKEAEFNLKKYKLEFKYNNKEEDQWRRLSDSERTNGSTRLNNMEGWAKDFSYTPFTIKKYDKILEERDFLAGPYNIFDTSFNFKTEWHESLSEKTLDRTIDPFREGLNISEREKEYHRSENILYEKIENENVVLNLNQKTRNLRIEQGTETNNYIDRSDVDEGITYNNISDYTDIKISDSKINLYKLGTIDASGGRREDNYNYGDTSYKDSLGIKHAIDLYDNSGDYLRWADLKLQNNFGFYVEKHRHEEGSYNYSLEEITNVNDYEDLSYYRLNNKRNKLNYNNTVTFDFGNTTSIYNFDMKNNYSAYDTNWKTDTDMLNSLEFKIDKKRSLFVSYREQEYFLKNDRDKEASNYDEFNEEYFRERFTNRFTLNLSGETEAFTYQNIKSSKDVRDKKANPNQKDLGLAYKTNTYGDLLTREDTVEDIYTYEFGEKDIYWAKVNYSNWTSDIYDYNSGENTRERYRDKYGLELKLGAKETNLFRVSYEDYEDVIEDFNNSKKYTFRYEYKDERDKEEENVVFSDFSGKYTLELSQEELEALDRKYREERRKERGLGFDILGLGDDSEDNVIYKRYYSLYLEATTNEKYLKYSSDFMKSVKYYQIRGEFHYNSFRFDYRYDQEIEFTEDTGEKWGIKREVEESKHFASVLTQFGKINYMWKLKGELTYLEEPQDDEVNLESWKISINKEYDFMQFGIEYEEEWSESRKEYDWLWRLKFALTTFPDKGFGAGRKYENGNESYEFKGGI